ncbi:MAG: LysM peptidoglycan-binding domain-containing protein [Prolixibacteraceae bacterium]
MKITWFVVFLLTLSLLSTAQTKNLNVIETVTIDGKVFLLHQVKAGETLFSICKEYSVEQKDLIGANPQLIFGLKQDDQLKIPYNSGVVAAKKAENDKASVEHQFIYHVVKKSETIYSISKLYNVPIWIIYRYNPEAEDEVLENEIIRIPQFEEERLNHSGLVREDNDFFFHKVQAQENLYSLSRKYGSEVAAIIEYNPDVVDQLQVGTIVRIPKFKEQVRQVDVKETGEYFYHTVETGDTFYSYQRRFGVSPKMLLDLNPELSDGLQAGLTIKIPSTQIQKIEVVPVQPELFIEHIVVNGETLYGISKKYGAKVMDLKELNPELKSRGVIAGETILISNKDLGSSDSQVPNSVDISIQPDSDFSDENSAIPEVIFKYEEEEQPECKKTYSVSKGDTFRIAMFLPFYFNKNDSLNLEQLSEKSRLMLDSLKRTNPEVLKKYFKITVDPISHKRDTVLLNSLGEKPVRSLYPRSKDAVSFFQGVLIAVDSMQKAGAKVRLDLFDTERDIRKINRILNQPDFINTDLIIGPIDTVLQMSVSSYSAKNRIPMVSPFTKSKSNLDNNPYYFQVSPSKDYMLRKTADFVADEYYNKNFMVVTLGDFAKQNEFEMVNMLREKFFSRGILNSNNAIMFTQVDFTGTDGYWQVKNILKKDVENVIFIPTTDNRSEREAILSRAMNSLNVLAEEYSITLIGVIDYPSFKSIKTEYFHKLKLHFLTPNSIDYYNHEVNTFLAKFRMKFKSEPDMLSYRGYDIITYFVGAYEEFGKNFGECIGTYVNPSLQSDFNFQKVNRLGGYMNHSLYIMQYTPDYTIKVLDEITEGRTLRK